MKESEGHFKDLARTVRESDPDAVEGWTASVAGNVILPVLMAEKGRGDLDDDQMSEIAMEGSAVMQALASEIETRKSRTSRRECGGSRSEPMLPSLAGHEISRFRSDILPW